MSEWKRGDIVALGTGRVLQYDPNVDERFPWQTLTPGESDSYPNERVDDDPGTVLLARDGRLVCGACGISAPAKDPAETTTTAEE